MRLVALALCVSASAFQKSVEPPSAAGSTSPRAAETPEAFLRRFDERNKSVRDFSGKFTQSFRSGALGRQIVESGTVRVKRPGRMSFDYEKPEKKRFVADGQRYYFYVPSEKQVVIQAQQGDRRAAARVLAEGSLMAAFRFEREEPDSLGRRFVLVPIEKDADVPRVSIVIDGTLHIKMIEIEDAMGGRSRIAFDAIKENTGLKERDFVFKIPQGVEVIS